MLGALGAILPEAINAIGGNVPGAVWWQARFLEKRIIIQQILLKRSLFEA